MLNRSKTYVFNRWTIISDATGLHSSVVMASSNFDSLNVTADTLSKPANRALPHPQAYTKSVGTTNWIGSVYAISPDYVHSSLVIGPQAYTFAWSYGVPVGFSTEAENECLSKINEAIRGGIDLSIDLAEAGQTVKLTRQIGRAVMAIRQWRTTFGKATWSSVPDVASEAWLTWQYGIRPMINTIYESADAMKRSAERCMVIRKRAGIRTQKSGTRNPNFLSGEFGPREKYTEWSSQRVEIKYVLSINATVLQQLGNWTSLNPVSIAWELTPYSFVVDWFVDVGSYLRNMESAFLYRNAFKTGYITRTWKAGVTSTVNFTANSKIDLKLYAYDLRAARIDSGKQRAVLTNVLLPYPPKFSVKMGWQRFASAASLINSLLIGRREKKLAEGLRLDKAIDRLQRKERRRNNFSDRPERRDNRTLEAN